MEGEQDEPVVLSSAFRHDVPEEDMLHPVRHAIRWFTLNNEMTIVIGPSTTGAMLEAGVVAWYGEQLAIVHAMPARKKFQR